MSTVKLGDVAIESRDSLKEKDKSLPVVGLEHLIPEQIILTDWNIGQDNTFTKIFEKGDVLFGRRRAYLKKAAVAPCKGICSGDITVIRAREDKIHPELLPFVIQNDIFFDYAVGKSAGSLSPRVKWEHLANYEFNLPELDEQKKLAEVLWQIVDTMESYKKLLAKTDEMVKAKFVEMFGDPVLNPYKIQTKKMKDVAPVESYNGVVDLIEDKVWLLNLDMIESNTGKIIERNCVFEKDLGNSVWKFNTENVLYSKLRPYLNKVIVPDMSGYATTELLPLKPNTNFITKKFLDVLLRHDSFVNYINSKTAGTKMPRVSMDIFRNFDVIIPPLESQQQFTDFVQDSEESKAAIQASLDSLSAVYKKIIAENLGGSN